MHQNSIQIKVLRAPNIGWDVELLDFSYTVYGV